MPILLSCPIILQASIAQAEDVVRISTASGSRLLRGEILDYTGQLLELAGADGRARTLPAKDVIEIETLWTDAHRAGRDALAQRDYVTATGQLIKANRAESRVWVRRLILTELMRCFEATGQIARAGDLLLVIARSDPTTPAYSHAPLAWFATSAVSQAKAESWLALDDEPAAVLLGASYLQSTSSAAVARAALARLLDDPDARVAALAEAQLWRGEVIRATAADVARWADRVEQMPAGVRAGPYFVLGWARARLAMADEASLAYLRVAVQYAERRELAARALLAAARLSRRADRQDEMALLCQEVVEDFSDTRLAAEARALLQEAGQSER